MTIALLQFAAFDILGTAVSQQWEKWLTRFERLLNKITESADKRASLLHFVREIADYATGVRKLSEYFKPQVTTEYEVFNFHKCEQMADETIDAYCTRLRELAASCKFHDREIKTQIVTKCNSRKLRLRAFSEELTLESLL